MKEFVSSGLSHSEGEYPYLGSLPYYELMFFVPDVFNVASPHGQNESQRFIYRNYGLLTFNLGSSLEESSLTFELKDLNGITRLAETLDRNHFRYNLLKQKSQKRTGYSSL